jgi:site-specific recombinase XerD
MISEYRQERYDDGKTAATVNRELGFLRNAYNVAIRQYKWCIVNPVANVKFDKENNMRDKAERELPMIWTFLYGVFAYV